MSLLSMRGLLLASAFTVSLNGVGWAADVTEAQAEDLTARLRTWMSGLVANRLPIPPDAVIVTPDGQNYRIAFPMPPDVLRLTDAAGKPTNALITYVVRPLDGTRWSIQDIALPGGIVLGPRAAEAMKQASPGTNPAAEFHMRSRSASGVYDTAQATESRIEYRMQGISYTLHDMGTPGESNVSVERAAGMQSLSPAGNGAMDYKAEGSAEGYKATFITPTAGAIQFSARRVSARLEGTGVMGGQLAALIQNGVTMAMDAQTGADNGDTKARRAGGLKLIGLLKNILAGLRLQETIEGIEINAADTPVSLGQITMEYGGEAPADRLRAFMQLGLTDLKIGKLPPQFADLAPRAADMRISVSNLDLKGLTRLAEASLADEAYPNALEEQLVTLLINGETNFAIDQILIDLGFASLKATGKGRLMRLSTVREPVSGRAEGQVTITGFDALMERAGKLPNADQALPVLALIKGFGKADGDRMVWNLLYDENRQFLVNGVDVTKMGGKPR